MVNPRVAAGSPAAWCPCGAGQGWRLGQVGPFLAGVHQILVWDTSQANGGAVVKRWSALLWKAKAVFHLKPC